MRGTTFLSASAGRRRSLTRFYRCVQLNLPDEGTTDPTAWPAVINKLKESIVAAFDDAIVEREEEVKRGEAQRLTVGWNFCTWFLLKVSIGLLVLAILYGSNSS